MTDMWPDAMVVQALDRILAKSAKPQKAGVSVTRRTYYRVDPNDGHLWAEVVFTTDDGKGTVHPDISLPIASPTDLDAYDASINRRMFALAKENVERRRAR
jgi:hypothetical protein